MASISEHILRSRISSKDIKRFFRKFKINDRCWNWTDKPVQDGYAQFGIGGKSFRANRISYFLANDFLPDKFIMHTCDNRLCVNPSHLVSGTAKDNSHDCMRKGRHGIGSKNGASKLTEAQVSRMRRLYDKYRRHGGMIQRELAKKFGVSRVLVSDITRGKTWKHVTPSSF